jgi:hypothetical protein
MLQFKPRSFRLIPGFFGKLTDVATRFASRLGANKSATTAPNNVPAINAAAVFLFTISSAIDFSLSGRQWLPDSAATIGHVYNFILIIPGDNSQVCSVLHTIMFKIAHPGCMGNCPQGTIGKNWLPASFGPVWGTDEAALPISQ